MSRQMNLKGKKAVFFWGQTWFEFLRKPNPQRYSTQSHSISSRRKIRNPGNKNVCIQSVNPIVPGSHETRYLDAQRPYTSQPSSLVVGGRYLWVLEGSDSVLISRQSMLNSSSSHSSSSSSSSAGLSRPPTLERRSRSAALAAKSCCSFSSAYSSALSPENSFNWMRKSRTLSLNRS